MCEMVIVVCVKGWISNRKAAGATECMMLVLLSWARR